MLQSLITYGYLYSKELSADKAPTVLQPLDEVVSKDISLPLRVLAPDSALPGP